MLARLYNSSLVTGAAGFLGSFLSTELLAAGYKVIGIDNLFRGKMENIKHLEHDSNFEFHELDLLSAKHLRELKRIIVSRGVDIIFHYAAVNGTRYFYEQPFRVLKTNAEATTNLLNILSETSGVKKIVYASSSEVYGDPLEIPTPETHPIILRVRSERDSYAASKAVGEFYIRLFSQQRGLSYLILRIFNCYGERMDTSEYGQVVPEFIWKILTGSEFTMFGNGTQTRSFCYVADNIRMSLAATHQVDNEILNVGSDEEVAVIHLARLLHKIAQRAFEPKFLPLRAHDHQRRCPDISQIKQLTGESPRISLAEGLQRVLNYYRARIGKAQRLQ